MARMVPTPVREAHQSLAALAALVETPATESMELPHQAAAADVRLAASPALGLAAKCASRAGEENMGQRPLIKDGVVVNVIEIEDDTQCLRKADYKRLTAAEDADHEAQMAEWRATVAKRQADIAEARQSAFIAVGVVNALKVQQAAEAEKPRWKRLIPSHFESRITSAANQVRAAREKIAELEAQEMHPKPKLVRPKRWFHPDGLVVGPAGGNIGDRWDGKSFTRPEKKSA
jgi:hypothetical protein